MRLLPKSEIDKAKTQDRAREVAEGLKLSRRVDGLREMRVKEEEALEKFRDGTLQSIMKDIEEANSKKEIVLRELQELEAKAKKELSKSDKKRLDDLKNSLELREKELKDKEFDLSLIELDVSEAKKEAEEALNRQRLREKEADELRKQTLAEKQEAEAKLVRAKKIEDRAIKDKEKTEARLTLKEQELSEKEKEIMKREEENAKILKQNEKDRIWIADQRATLQRAMERLKKSRL